MTRCCIRTDIHHIIWLAAVYAAALCLFARPAAALERIQAVPASPGQSKALDFRSALQVAVATYPSLRVSSSRQTEARENIGLVKTQYLPHMALMAQELRATRNNILGVVSPNDVIPVISGPVLGTRSWTSAWNSNMGMRMYWDIYDFGERKYEVREARANQAEAAQHTALTRLDIEISAGHAFLNVVEADQRLIAQRANVERLQVVDTAVHALVDADLRPGVDASRADGELALARDKLIEAQYASDVQRANLAEALGLAGEELQVLTGPLTRIPAPQPVLKVPELITHPLALERSAAVDKALQHRKVIDRSWYPKVYFTFDVSYRGSGANPNGTTQNDKGFLPSVSNFATGFYAEWYPSDFFAVHQEKKMQNAEILAQHALYDQIMQTLKGSDARARALVVESIHLAENAPTILKAARESELRSKTRYEVGLGNIVDVAQAESLLSEAEVKYAIAGLQVWRALFNTAAAHGDLTPFLELLNRAGTGG